MLFNLYVADLPDCLSSEIKGFQYTDDATIYTSFMAPGIVSQAEALHSTLLGLQNWSSDCNLALNAKKTKVMLISTSQIDNPLERARNSQASGCLLNGPSKVRRACRSAITILLCGTVYFA